MNLKKFSDGIAIIQQFYGKPEGHHISAEHDQIFLCATDKPMDDASVLKLRELGWFQDDAVDDGKGDAVYDPNAGWSAFV